jgi:hypothetical protein
MDWDRSADGTPSRNATDNPAADKNVDFRNRPIRRLGSSDCSSISASGLRSLGE